MKTFYTIYSKITGLSLSCWLICSMNGLYAQPETDTIPQISPFPIQVTESVRDQNPGEEITAGLLLGEQNDSLQIEPLIETEITAEGDTLYLYRYEAFDLGDIYTGRPDITVAETTVGRLGDHAAAARVGTMSSGGNGEVGNISFSEGITPSGGRTYSIPVATAPVASSAPQIAIAYNSQAGNGVAGYGWNVVGTSAITVGGKNHYYDNFVSPVDLSNALTNALFIDGTRLVTNTGNLTEYQYESAQGFVLVKRNMYNSNTIAYFTVLYPNGSEATFGFTNNTQNRLVYPLTSIRDIKGYRIDFEYIISGNNYHISTIRYGSKSQSSHPGLISFTYTARTDVTPVYDGGTELKQDRLLTKIVTSNNGSELRTYSLSHTLKDGVNLLNQLDCSVGTSSLNPLTFEYGNAYDQSEGYLVNDATQFLAQYFPQSAKPIHHRGKFIKNKFNDGLIALPGVFSTYGVTKEKVKKFLGIVVGGPWYEFGSLYPADQTILIAPGLSFYSPTRAITAEAGFQTITAADVNGDGTDEIIKVNFDGIASGKTQLKITVYSVSADGTLSSYVRSVLVQGIVQDDEFTSPISRDYFFGDFKGDGKVQLLTVSHNKTFRGDSRPSYFALIDLTNGSLLSENSLFSYASSDGKYLHTIDINGDGKMELCYATSSGYEVWALQSNNTFSKQATYTGIYRSTF